MNQGFELFYPVEGHCGPFYTLEHARSEARRRLRGCPSMDWIDIVERDATAVGGYGHRVMRIRQTEDNPGPNQMAY